MKRWMWIALLGGGAAAVVGAYALGAKASEDLPPPPDPPPAPPKDAGVGAATYGPCPRCGGTDVGRERRINGDDVCNACGYKWKSGAVNIGVGSAYGVTLAQWAAQKASQLPQYRRFFWTWRRLLETVEPPGGCVGPLNLVDQAQNVADGISKNQDSPDADLYASAQWLYAAMMQLQGFKTARVATFGTCSWGP